METKELDSVINTTRLKLKEVFNENNLSDIMDKCVFNNCKYKAFRLEFIAYNYMPVVIHYENGKIRAYIETAIGLKIMLLESVEYNLDEDNKMLEQLKHEIKSRIPDKYLSEHSYK